MSQAPSPPPPPQQNGSRIRRSGSSKSHGPRGASAGGDRVAGRPSAVPPAGADAGTPSSNLSVAVQPVAARRLREGPVGFVTGMPARTGLGLMMLSAAVMTKFTKQAVVLEIIARCLCGEAVVQIGIGLLTRPLTSINTAYHVALWILSSTIFFWFFPLEAFDQGTLVAFGSVLGFPLGVYLFIYGMVTTQLEYHMSSVYWTLGSDSSRNASASSHGGPGLGGNRPELNFALIHQSPVSIIVVLRVTHLMVQLLEISGLPPEDRNELTKHRNNFLYRVRNSSSHRHKAIAVEQHFRDVAGLLMHCTARSLAHPNSGTYSFMERQFANRLLDRSEVFIKPLPKPLDPDNIFKWVALTVSALLLHKRLFQSIKASQGGSLDPPLQASKYVSRFGILVYLTARYIITQTKRGGPGIGVHPPRMFN